MKPVRNTLARAEILKLINSSSVALSHAEIRKELSSVCNRVTVYRLLERLISENAIHRIVTPKGTITYAACRSCPAEKNHISKHNHIHFSCEICNQVTCLEDLNPTFNIPPNYRVKAVNLTLSGICPKCS